MQTAKNTCNTTEGYNMDLLTEVHGKKLNLDLSSMY